MRCRGTAARETRPPRRPCPGAAKRRHPRRPAVPPLARCPVREGHRPALPHPNRLDTEAAGRPEYARRVAIPRYAAIAATAITLLVAGCAFGPPDETEGGTPPNLPRPTPTKSASGDDGPPGVVATVIAQGLEVPWAIDFLPDGAALATERDSLRIVRLGPERGPDGLKITPVQPIDEAVARGEGGLLGLAVSPNYATDKTVFIYYTTATDNRIARLVLGEEPEPIVTGIPVSGIHNGGRLHFEPDGYLNASTGDDSNRGLAQDLDSLAGKILRMTPEGKPAPGNPYPDSLVWSYGHRNVQGFDW